VSHELVANGYNYKMTTVSPKPHYSGTSKQPMRQDWRSPNYWWKTKNFTWQFVSS